MCLANFDKIGHVLLEKIAKKKHADEMQLEMSMNIQSPLRRGNLAGTQDIGFGRTPTPLPILLVLRNAIKPRYNCK